MAKVLSKEHSDEFRRKFFFFLIFLFSAGLVYIFSKNLVFAISFLIISQVLFNVYFYFRKRLVISTNIRKMESVFPDFIELVSSNLRAGMTIDKALLLGSRKEFAPLDKEILHLGKDILTGREIALSLRDMARRTGSERIQKTVDLIVSGLKSGGNVAVLLEETAVNMRERNFVEKRAASNVLMYVILISFGISIGAPALFALSSVLVGVMTQILADVPQSETNLNLPFSITGVSISTTFITIYAVVFLVVVCILSSMLLGLVSKGDEKEGLKYAPIFISVSLVVFFILKSVLGGGFSSMLG